MGKVVDMPGVLRLMIAPDLLTKVRAFTRGNPRMLRAFVEEALADALLEAGMGCGDGGGEAA